MNHMVWFRPYKRKNGNGSIFIDAQNNHSIVKEQSKTNHKKLSNEGNRKCLSSRRVAEIKRLINVTLIITPHLSILKLTRAPGKKIWYYIK